MKTQTALAGALRSYQDTLELIADCSARIAQRYAGSRRVKIAPKGQGFSVLTDGMPVAKIDQTSHDFEKIREKIDAAITA